MVTRDAGFSLPELLVAMGIGAAVMAGAFGLMQMAQHAFIAQGEAADMEQRLRVAADTLTRDLVMAGAGSRAAQGSAVPQYAFAPILPYRRGLVRDDPAGTFRSDVLTVLYAPSTPAGATLAADLTSTARTLTLNAGAGCPLGEIACGLKQGDSILIHDAAGSFDTFTLGIVTPGRVEMVANRSPGTPATTYGAGSKVAKIVQRTYALKSDSARNLYQLVSYDGGSNSDVPIVDHVVGLEFEYFADSRLTAADLTDGPWYPDASSANRFDADLLRVRKIGVTLRVEAADDALRGPSGTLFVRGGTSRTGTRQLPDEIVRLDVAPRNLR